SATTSKPSAPSSTRSCRVSCGSGPAPPSATRSAAAATAAYDRANAKTSQAKRTGRTTSRLTDLRRRDRGARSARRESNPNVAMGPVRVEAQVLARGGFCFVAAPEPIVSLHEAPHRLGGERPRGTFVQVDAEPLRGVAVRVGLIEGGH